MKQNSKTYFGIGLHDSLENKRTAGTISFSGSEIIFSYDSGEVRLPFGGVSVSEGGSGNSLIYFSHPSYPDWSIYTSDKSILNDPVIKQNSNFGGLAKVRMKRNFSVFAWVISLSLLLTMIIYGIYWLRNSFGYAIASRVPLAWEENLGNSLFKSLTTGKKMYEDAETLKLLEPITKPLTEAASDSGYKFQFHIIEDESLNAFAIPGGHVIIHSGLIQKAESPEEIAGVLAHEISHVTERHSVRQIISSIGIFIVVQALFGDFTGLLAIITQNSGLLLRTKFSRDFEREADAKGFHYLYKSKMDPNGMLVFFGKILEEEKKMIGNSGDILSFISTHPGTEERMEVLKEKIAELPKKDFVPIPMKLSKLQKRLQ